MRCFRPFPRHSARCWGSLAAVVMVACGSSGGSSGPDGNAAGADGSNGGSPGGGSGGATTTGGNAGTGGTGGSLTDAGDASGGAGDTDASLGGAGAGGSGGVSVCATVTAPHSHANILFIEDRSATMNCNLPEDGQTTAQCESNPTKLDPTKPSKWQLTIAALENAFPKLHLPTTASAGLELFPADGTNCAVSSPPAVPIQLLDSGQEQTLGSLLDNEVPGGATPLAGAVIGGYAYLIQKWLQLPGTKNVVLLSDGYDTCQPTAVTKLLSEDVPKATSAGIRTFVVGLPGSESGRAVLSQIAYLGDGSRTPTCAHSASPADAGDCQWDLTTSTNFSGDLTEAFRNIDGTIQSCDFDLPPGAQPTPFGVRLISGTGSVWTVFENSPTGGWKLRPDGSGIRIYGGDCSVAEVDPATTLDVDIACTDAGAADATLPDATFGYDAAPD